jgi:hypothetical protein
MTSLETAEYFKQKGIPADVRTVKRYRTKIRKSAQNWVSKPAKSKSADYIAEYKERILSSSGRPSVVFCHYILYIHAIVLATEATEDIKLRVVFLLDMKQTLTLISIASRDAPQHITP